ncbi:hypothetical protein Dsin_023408 [Dipteronia sinensis]|uniref:Inner centromere protein ARK-binding domain-containing protein n=1 Tax=Dipteronia sinensis TaxID=43782 RepID=A0AAE0A379_9ROSI|nr:hypothetical protein Dsin_023408 [Dipteronia sinensis]
MSTMEKLFMQIFEKKNQIIEQVRHQSLLFDQQLAAKCLLDGIAPPPWLWSPSFPSAPSAPTELNKEELISELLLPCPPSSITYTEVRNSNKASDAGDRLSVSPQLPNDAGGASDGIEKPDSSSASSPQDQREERIPDFSPEPAQSLASFQRSRSRQRALELRNSAKADRSQLHVDNNTGLFATANTGSEIAPLMLDHVDELELVESDHNNNGSCEVEEANVGDLLSKGKEWNKEERISELLLPCPSSIPYTEVRNSSKAFNAGDRFSVSPQLPNDAGGASDGIEKPDSSSASSPQDQREGRIPDVSPEPAQSLASFQRSRSRQRALELRNSAKADRSQLCVDNNTGLFATGNTVSEIASLMLDHVDELELVESVHNNNGSCEVEEANVGDLLSNGKESRKEELISGPLLPGSQPATLFSSSDLVPYNKPAFISENEELFAGNNTEVTTDGQSDLLQLPIHDAGCDSNGVPELESGATSPQDQRNATVSDINSKPFQSLAMIQRSKSRQRALELRDSAKAAKSCLYVENDTNSLQPSSLRESSCMGDPTSVGRSSQGGENVDRSKSSRELIEEDLSCLRCFGSVGVGSCPQQVGGQITDAVSASPRLKEGDAVQSNVGRSLIDEMDHVEQSMTEGSKSSSVRISHLLLEHVDELETVEPVDIDCESGMVEDAKVHDVDNRETGSNLHSSRITRSGRSKVSPVRITSPVDEMNHVEQPMTRGLKPSPVRISHPLLEHVDELEIVKAVDIYCESSMVVEDAIVDDVDSREKGSNKDSGRITRSRSTKVSPVRIISPVDEMNHLELIEGSKPSSVKISHTLLEHDDEMETVKPVDIYYESGMVEDAKVDDLHSRENGSNLYSDIITRSGSSKVSPVRFISQVDEMNHVEQPMTGGSKSSLVGISSSLQEHVEELELLKPVDICYGNCVVEEAKVGDLQSREEGCSSPQLKRRRIGSQLNDSLSASPNLRGELNLEERDRSACTPFTFSYEESEIPLIPSLVHQATGDSKVCSDVEAGEADPTSSIHDSIGQERTSCPEENDKISYCSLGSPNRQSMELICADHAIPDLERFIMQTDSEQSQVAGEGISFKLNLSKNSIERASLLEQLCKSACMHTPLSQFSSTFKFHGEPNLYQSVPNGLLECIDMKSNLEVNSDVFKQFDSCYSYLNKGVNQEMSYSDRLPLSNAQSAWDIKKPFTSPVGKLWDRNTSNPGSSEKRGSLNPELFCISEENEYTEEVVDVVQENLVKEMMPTPVKREPLADVTENPNLPASASVVEIFAARNSLESVNTEYSFTGTCNGVTQKLGHHNSSKRGQTNKAKVSKSIFIEKYVMNRMSESVQGRFSKPQVSGKPGLRKEGPSLGEREAKRNNIVSNVSSFVPLVKQKQAAAIATGKKHNPVKALEAAELAKRLAHEKENKRNMEKEARKAERARMEQENLKQMELQKKIKKEESKKKEADMATRKRQREEEKDKEPKRKRGMEPRKQQQRENREKLRTKKEKELKCQPMRPKDMKASRNGAGKDNKKETEMGGENLGKLSKTEPKTTMVSTSDSIKASIVFEACEASTEYGDNLKVKSNLEKATVDNIFTNTYCEESYDISPYKESDDEDEDDDDIPNSKFIPSWASKNCLALAVSSQQGLNPDVMFTPESFCSISEGNAHKPIKIMDFNSYIISSDLFVKRLSVKSLREQIVFEMRWRFRYAFLPQMK